MIATTIEQGKRLMACGIKVETADMCRIFTDDNGDNISIDEIEEIEADGGEVYGKLIPKDFGDYDASYADDAPAWSLSALLTEVLPPMLDEREKEDLTVYSDLYLTYNSNFTDEYKWHCGYVFTDKRCDDDDPIEACVKMVELLHEKGIKF